MNKSSRFVVTAVGTLSIAAVGLFLSIMFVWGIFCLHSYAEATGNAVISAVELFLCASGGFIILTTEYTARRIMRDRLNRPDRLIIQSFGAFLYVIVMIALFPLVTELQFIYASLPRGEMASDIVLMFVQIPSSIVAVAYGLGCLMVTIGLHRREQRSGLKTSSRSNGTK